MEALAVDVGVVVRKRTGQRIAVNCFIALPFIHNTGAIQYVHSLYSASSTFGKDSDIVMGVRAHKKKKPAVRWWKPHLAN